jgi:hypothetical protein
MFTIAGGIRLAVAMRDCEFRRFESKVRFAAIFIGCFVLAGCASEPKKIYDIRIFRRQNLPLFHEKQAKER